MTVPFMRAYTELLVKTCHRRGAHAIGGMAAFIPSRRDPRGQRTALAKVREDKEREAGDGFDGTWVAHPDLVPVAMEVFDRVLGDQPHQKDRAARGRAGRRPPTCSTCAIARRARSPRPACAPTSASALQYLNSWLLGNGAAAINNLMEDAATAEISRAQLWQWIRHGARLADGRPVTADLYTQIRAEELARLKQVDTGRYGDAVAIMDSLVLNAEFTEFLTLPAYRYLD